MKDLLKHPQCQSQYYSGQWSTVAFVLRRDMLGDWETSCLAIWLKYCGRISRKATSSNDHGAAECVSSWLVKSAGSSPDTVTHLHHHVGDDPRCRLFEWAKSGLQTCVAVVDVENKSKGAVYKRHVYVHAHNYFLNGTFTFIQPCRSSFLFIHLANIKMPTLLRRFRDSPCWVVDGSVR